MWEHKAEQMLRRDENIEDNFEDGDNAVDKANNNNNLNGGDEADNVYAADKAKRT